MEEVLPNNLAKKSARGYQLIFGYLGLFIALIGVITLLPLLMFFFYPSEYRACLSFASVGLPAIVIGVTMNRLFIGHKKTENLGKYQDMVLLVLIWLAALLIGAFPYFLHQYLVTGSLKEYVSAYSYSEGLFESASGYTTTGLTIYRDLLDTANMQISEYVNANCPHFFLFYRSITHFFGGVGLVLIVASVMSDSHGLKLYYAEGHNDKLLPNLAKSARLILGIYSLYIALGTLLFWFFGMDWFDAFNHSVSALATGGLSTRTTSIYFFTNSNLTGYYANNLSAIGLINCGGLSSVFPSYVNSIGIEVVACICMLLGGTSFILHSKLLTFRWKSFFRDSEVIFFFVLMIITVPLIMFSISQEPFYQNASFGEIFRYGFFHFISAISTTGFSNVPSILSLGEASLLLFVIIFSIGACTGSTAGGMKQYRLALCFKEISWDLKYRFSSSHYRYPTTVYRHGERVNVNPQDYKEASFFVLIYLLALIVGSTIISSLPSISFEEGIYGFGSALSSDGTFLMNIIGYGHNELSAGVYSNIQPYYYNILLWTLAVGMFLGRLEIIPVYYSFLRLGKDIFHKEA